MAPEQNIKRGFSEKVLRDAVEKELHPETSTSSYKPYKEAIDYLLAEQNQSIQNYQKAYGFANEDIAYQQFYATHQDVVHAQNDAMNDAINNSFQAPSQPQVSEEEYLQQQAYTQQLEAQNAQLQEQVATDQQQIQEEEQELDQEKYNEEVLEYISQEEEKIRAEEVKQKKKILKGPPRWHMILIWSVFGILYVVDNFTVGLTPIVGDVLSTLIAVVVWFIVAAILDFSVFRFAIKYMLLDLVVSVVADVVIGGATAGLGLIATMVLDALVEPYIIFRKMSPQQLYKKHYFEGVKEADKL